MVKSTRPEPPTEAALIDAARRRARLTVREAAQRSGLSEARWRQITNGYQVVSGTKLAVKAPAETLARMALAMGLAPEQLARVGRPDAAEVLEEIAPPGEAAMDYAPPQGATAEYTPPVDAVYAILASLPPEAQAEVVRRLAREHPAAVQPPPSQERRVS